MHIEKVIQLKPPHCWTHILLVRKLLRRVITTITFSLDSVSSKTEDVPIILSKWAGVTLETVKQQGEPSHAYTLPPAHKSLGSGRSPQHWDGPIPSDAAGFDASCHNHPSWWWFLRGKGWGWFWIPGTEYNMEPFIWGSAPVSEVRWLKVRCCKNLLGKGKNPDQHASSCLFQHPTVSLFSSLWANRKQGTNIATVPKAKL